MKKVVLLVAGTSAAAAMAVIGAGQAAADVPDVTGETYAAAQAILQSQGFQAVFGGSVGSDLPQAQCIVIEQKQQGTTMWNTPWGTAGSMRLRLDCGLHPGQTKPPTPGTLSRVPPGGSGSIGGGGNENNRPTPGAGTVTVTPVPVG